MSAKAIVQAKHIRLILSLRLHIVTANDWKITDASMKRLILNRAYNRYSGI